MTRLPIPCPRPPCPRPPSAGSTGPLPRWLPVAMFAMTAAGFSACDGLSGVSDLEFGRGVGSQCSADTDCDQGNYCDLELGRCAQQKHLGDPCTEARECDTDLCADGVCCDSACDDFCEACNVEGSEGSCVQHSAGTDPENECPGTATCDGQGQCTGQHLWSHSFGDEETDQGVSVAVDSQNNVIIAGHFQGSLSLGADPFDAVSGNDVYLAKYDPAGNHLWSQRFGGSDNQVAATVVVDSADRIVLGGHFSGTIDFGTPLDSASYSDIYVAKFTPDGQVLWAKRFGDAGSQLVHDVAVDGSDNIAITGAFNGTINFDGETHDRVGTSYEDVYVAKLDPNGNVLWHAAYGNEQDQEGEAVAFDGAGNLILAGWFYSGGLAVGGSALQNEGATDIFVAKYNSAGAHSWSRRFGDGSYQYISDIAIDSDENILITGPFEGAVNFGGNQLSSTHWDDIYVAKLTPDGSHAWSNRYGGEFDQASYGIAIDPSNNVFVTGMFTLGVDLGGGHHECAGEHDAFIVKLDSQGEHVWSQPFGDLIAEQGNGVAADTEGNLLLIGSYQYRIDLGGGAFDAEGNTDIFLAKFGP